MKRSKYLILAIFTLVLAGCNEELVSVNTEVLIDITEEDLSQLRFEDVNEAILYISKLDTSDVSHNKVCYSLTPISELTTNPQIGDCLKEDDNKFDRSTGKRILDIKEFSEGINQNLDQLKKEVIRYGRDSTEVYKTIQNALVSINRKSGIKHVLIFSDLLHHMNEFSFYEFKGKEESFTEELIDDSYNRLQKHYPLPQDLSQIKISVIFQPDVSTDRKFELAKRWWTRVIKKHNGSIIFYSNVDALINNYNPRL